MKWKNIRLKLTAAAMTAAMGLQMTVQPLQAAAAATQYLSEVIISYGSTDAEAKNWLTSNGYKVVNQNLNEGGEGGSDAFSWLGLASEKRSVYLGYKTTTDPDEAITDMKIMNMNGGYSYEAYEKVLKELEQEKTHFLENIMAALTEYRANYKKGAVKAKIAHDNLNKFKDDDSGQLMGDLLLNTIKTEDEAAWEADPTQHADMVTILMQGNSTCVSEIMQNLAFAADTADDSFVNRAIAAANAEESPFDTFFDSFMEQHPGYTKDEAVTELMQLYDDHAKMFASSLIGLRNFLSNYTKSQLSMNAAKEAADAYFAEHQFENPTSWARSASTYQMLSTVYYGDSSLVSYLVYSSDDYLSDDALLSGYDALHLPQRAKLYPFIAQMSAGQRCLLEYTAMDRMLTMGLMDDETWQSTYATMQDSEFGADALEPCSVYAEVNRNDFKVGEIAVTNAAQGKAASLGEEVNEGLLGVGISNTTAGLMIGGIAVTIAGIAIAAKNWPGTTVTVINELGNTPALREALRNGKSLYTGMISKTSKGYVKMLYKLANTPQEATNMLVSQKESLDTLIWSLKHEHDLAASGLKNTLNVDLYMRNFAKGENYCLTVSGPKGDIEYDMGVVVQEDWDGSVQYLKMHDGTIIYPDGSTQIDMNIRNQYNETMTLINPDFKATTIKTEEFLKQTADEAGKSVDDLIEEAQKQFEDLADDKELQEAIKSYYAKNHPGEKIPSLIDLPDDELDDLLDQVDDDIPILKQYDNAAIIKQKHVLQAQQYRDNNLILADKMDDIAEGGEEGIKQTTEQADDVMTVATGSTFWKWFGVGMAIVGLAMSVYSAYSAISEMKAYYHQEMLPIPRKMVDLGYYDDGSHCYIYYDCTKCNRSAMNMANETLGDYGDLNGDVMKQWIALYTTKDKRAGSPIQAGFTVKKGTTSIPVRTVPLSFFGFDYAVNMTDTKFTYNNNLNGIYLYYKQIASKYTGTVETGNALVATGVLSALGGAGVCGLIIALASKRKKKEPTGEPTAA